MRVGFTFDRTERMDAIVRFLKGCAFRPAIRLICDPPWAGFTWEQLREPCRVLGQYADIMLSVSDSTAFAKYSPDDYIERTRKAIAEYGKAVKWFEIGNEIGGNWLGKQEDVDAKVRGALMVARAAGVLTAITWYLSGDTPSVLLGTWKRIQAPADIHLISYYPNWSPQYRPDWDVLFQTLAIRYPDALVGIGEFGPEPRRKTAMHRAQMIREFYRIRFASSRFFGGFFYWDTWQDVCGKPEPKVVEALRDISPQT